MHFNVPGAVRLTCIHTASLTSSLHSYYVIYHIPVYYHNTRQFYEYEIPESKVLASRRPNTCG